MKNDFEIDSKLYIQKQVTSMGTRIASSHAHVFVIYLEGGILDTAPKPSIWLRFMDDIFMIWPHGTNEL